MIHTLTTYTFDETGGLEWSMTYTFTVTETVTVKSLETYHARNAFKTEKENVPLNGARQEKVMEALLRELAKIRDARRTTNEFQGAARVLSSFHETPKILWSLRTPLDDRELSVIQRMWMVRDV